MKQPTHHCPFCGCYFGELGVMGGTIPGTPWTVEGLVQKVARLAKELRECRQALTRRRGGSSAPS